MWKNILFDQQITYDIVGDCNVRVVKKNAWVEMG